MVNERGFAVRENLCGECGAVTPHVHVCRFVYVQDAQNVPSAGFVFAARLVLSMLERCNKYTSSASL